MRKFISAAIAFAMTATAMAGMTVARADGPTYIERGESVTNVSDLTELTAAFNNGGSYQLTGDIESTGGMTLNNNKDLYLDLNGYTLTLGESGNAAITTKGNLTLTNTKKTGSLVHTGSKSALRIGVAGKNINIEDVIITSSSNNNDYGAIFFAAKNNNVRIYNTKLTASSLASQRTIVIGTGNTGNTLTMGGNATDIRFGSANGPFNANLATITITGGTYSFDPSAYVDEENYDVTEGTGTWTVTEKAAPPAPAASYFTVEGNVDKAGTYTKVNVTADINGDTKTATKELSTTLTLNDAEAVSIGIAVTDIPDGTTFEITRITLE